MKIPCVLVLRTCSYDFTEAAIASRLYVEEEGSRRVSAALGRPVRPKSPIANGTGRDQAEYARLVEQVPETPR